MRRSSQITMVGQKRTFCCSALTSTFVTIFVIEIQKTRTMHQLMKKTVARLFEGLDEVVANGKYFGFLHLTAKFLAGFTVSGFPH